MTDVGEETQLDIRHLLLYLYLAAQLAIDANDINDEQDKQHYAYAVEHPCPPAQPPWTGYEDRKRLFVLHLRAFA